MSSIESPQNLEPTPAPTEESSFGDMLRQFEAEHQASEGQEAALEGTVVSVSEEGAVIDIGRKMEGILKPSAAGQPLGLEVGSKLRVSISGFADGGYYLLSTMRVEQPKDFSALQSAFENKKVISGTVLEQVKGGLRVDVGVPAFLPASRSGIREMSELATLLGQQIEVRITKLDVSNPDRPDVVVDRRGVLEELTSAAKREAFERFAEGTVVQGRVRTLTDFGAFVELAQGIDGLLHVSDLSWNRVEKPSAILTEGQELEVKILKINKQSRKISLGVKQLTPDPWTLAMEKYKQGDRVKGKVVRLADFGAFVEIEPGVDGLIHLSEMSWTRRVRKPGEVVQLGEMVEAVIIEIKPGDKRIALGLKQALGNPWDDVEQRFPAGKQVEAVVRNMAQFGVFVDLGDGLEGMIHIGDITREKRIQHPKEMVSEGQTVKAVVLEVDREKRRIRLGMKQLEPTSADLFMSEHKVGDELMARIVDAHGSTAKVEISEGVHARCKTKEEAASASAGTQTAGSVDDLAAMLASRWKSGGSSSAGGKDTLRAGQIRKVRITSMDSETKRIEVELAE